MGINTCLVNRFNGKFAEHKKKISFYSITTLKDAAWLLYDTKEIYLLSNPNHQFDIELKILPDGIKAMNEMAYVWKVLKPAFFFIGAITTLITGVYAVVKIIK